MPQASQKQQIRQSMLAWRKNLPQQIWHEASLAAQQKLLASPAWQQAASVALFRPIRHEIDTSLLLKTALQEGKQVFLPRVASKTEMRFLRYIDQNSVAPGVWGILEPKPDLPEASQIDLLLTPGLAFDARGYRLGYGGGYYDNFLGAHPGFATIIIGFCFAGQIVAELPNCAWDIPVNAIHTEEGCHDFV